MNIKSPEDSDHESRMAAVRQAARAFKRLQGKYTVDPDTGCWLWTASLQPAGYANFDSVSGRTGHRFTYEYFVATIPEGLVIDHLCRVRRCVNPEHLEAVTTAENIRRGETAKYQRDKTHCAKGHPYDEKNTKRYYGWRQCIACSRERDRIRAPRRRLAIKAAKAAQQVAQ